MTTSRDQRTMHRIPADHPVRRVLLPAVIEESRVDNFINTLHESVVTERMEKMRKWNFDFEKEVPTEGPWVWFKSPEFDSWIGENSDNSDIVNSEKPNEDDTPPVQLENEITPKIRNETPKSKLIGIRKRKMDALKSMTDPVARRKIDF